MDGSITVSKKRAWGIVVGVAVLGVLLGALLSSTASQFGKTYFNADYAACVSRVSSDCVANIGTKYSTQCSRTAVYSCGYNTDTNW